MTERRIGTIDHYYPKVHAAVLHVESGSLKVGDHIHIRGRYYDIEDDVRRMEIDHKPVQEARKGQEVGLQLEEPVRGKAEVFLVAED